MTPQCSLRRRSWAAKVRLDFQFYPFALPKYSTKREIVRQVTGIGGRSLGLGSNRVRSLPDGIGQVLDMYLHERAGALPGMEEKKNGNGGSVGHQIEEEAGAAFELKPTSEAAQWVKIGDLCPAPQGAFSALRASGRQRALWVSRRGE